MEIIKIWEYHHRIIFLTKIKGKYQLFYKSSGRAGHGSKDMVFPHLLLKANKEFSPDGLGEWMSVGWIVKYFKYDGRLLAYRHKRLNEFPTVMHSYMKELEDLDLTELDVTVESDSKIINDFCQQYIHSKENYVDWKELEIGGKYENR